MNPISAFFVRNIVAVFFLYGLAFFAMGLALALASRRTSEFRFVQAIRPLAAFGILHGVHEWIEMFQKIAALNSGYIPTITHEVLRLITLLTSFLMLSTFGILLLQPEEPKRKRTPLFVSGLAGLWLLSVLIAKVTLKPSADETIILADVLARYSLGIPGALLGAWALMAQQHTFREHGMPQFGRDLVWCATALILYGVIGQIFVHETAVAPAKILNSTNFLQWFGIPIQLFRGVMAAILAFFMVRALDAFELENRHRLQTANEAQLKAQQTTLEAERRVSREMERLNEELQLTARELSLLLNLSNLLATPMSLEERLHSVLEKIVQSLGFPDAGMVLLIRRETEVLDIRAAMGCDGTKKLYTLAQDLGRQCVEKAIAMCRHQDGTIIEFSLEEVGSREECRRHTSPVTMISLPLTARSQVIGSTVLCRIKDNGQKSPSPAEFQLMIGIAQQLGLSIENARLNQEAQEREQLLGELLNQAVGTQEAERKRIARELHDATGQSLTAIALGLRGTEAILDQEPAIAAKQIRELQSFTVDALSELRQFIADLRPSQLDDLGLVAALQWYIQEFEKRYAIETDFVIEGDRVRLPSEYETVLFRIAQEALNNIVKHANASRASIKLNIQRSQICVSIQDNGRGFNPEQVLHGNRPYNGWGLLGIQERTLLLGGQYQLKSEPGKGTCVSVIVPLRTEAKDVQDSIVTS